MKRDKPKGFTKYIYKYFTGDASLGFFQNFSIRVTPPREFNDPFDCIPPYCDRLEEWNAINYEKKKHQHLYTKEELLKHEDIVIKGVADTFSDKYGVICFSGRWDIPPMWSHYSGNHQGVCITFDARDDFFHDTSICEIPLTPVQYNNQRHRLIPDKKGDWKLESGVKTECIIRRKQRRWAYEKESRVVISLSNDALEDKIIEGRCGVKKFIRLIKVPESSIMEVTLGLRCDGVVRDSAVKFCSSNKIPMFEARMSRKNYEIERIRQDL